MKDTCRLSTSGRLCKQQKFDRPQLGDYCLQVGPLSIFYFYLFLFFIYFYLFLFLFTYIFSYFYFRFCFLRGDSNGPLYFEIRTLFRERLGSTDARESIESRERRAVIVKKSHFAFSKLSGSKESSLIFGSRL